MRSCINCSSRNKIFTFHNDATSYESAIQKCRNKNPGHNIATFLNADDYGKLLACCKNRKSYWIGLKNDDTNCSNASKRFRWNGSGRCFDEGPLNVQPQPTNGQCIAVSIKTIKPDSENTIPAELSLCEKAQGYICERMIDNSLTQRATTSSSTRITTTASTQTTLDLTAKTTNSKYIASTASKYNQRDNTEKLIPTYQPSTQFSHNPTNICSSSLCIESSFDDYMGLVVGAVVALIILLVVIAFLYRRYYKADSRCLPLKISSQLTNYNSSSKNNSISRFSTIEPNSLQHNNEVIKECDYQLPEAFSEQNEHNDTTEKNLNFRDQMQTVEEKNPYVSFDDTDFSDDELQGSGDQYIQVSTETEEGTCNDTNTPAVYASVIKPKNIQEECAYAVVNKN